MGTRDFFMRFLGAMLMVWWLVGCGGKSDYLLLQSDQNQTSSRLDSPLQEYTIMPQDRLKLIVYRDPEGAGAIASDMGQNFDSSGILVNSKGYIFLPLIKRIKVAGLTQSEASLYITNEYRRYLKVPPMVSLEVLNKRIYVIGEVNKPGPIELAREKMTLLEAIAHAGDLSDSAVRDNIIILSQSRTKKPHLRSVDLTNFDTMRLGSMMLFPNDVVYVQPDGWKEFKVASENVTAPFLTISQIATPFVQLHYLFD
jgi:polysaccharide export outer membrane protein